MAGEPHVVALDLGTSGPKTLVVSLSGRIAGIGRTFVDTIHVPGGGAEQDAQALWEAVKGSITQALTEADVSPADIKAVICGSQYSSIVPVDHTGSPLANMILWLDQRGTAGNLRRMARLPRGVDRPLQLLDWLRVHGLAPVAGGMSLNHMRFLKYVRPEVYARTAFLLEPMDYVAMRLTGRATATQCTSFMSLLMDNRAGAAHGYHRRLLRYGLIDQEKLPEAVPIDAVIGGLLPKIADELGLAPGTKVIAGMGDTHAGGMGSLAFQGSHCGLAMGSSSVLVTHRAKKGTDLRNALFALPSPIVGQYFAVAETGISGLALDSFLRQTIFAEDSFAGGSVLPEGPVRYAALERAVASVEPGAEGLIYLPWLTGSLAPKTDSQMRGGFINMSPRMTRSHMARAVLEGIALNLRWSRDPMQKFCGREFSHYLFYGGGAQSDICAQIMADVLQRPIHQLDHAQHITALGAALTAFARLKLIEPGDFAARVRERQVVEPNRTRAKLYDERFEQFTAAFKALRPLSHRMNSTQMVA